MTKFRVEELSAKTAVSVGGTGKYDLPEQGCLTGILLKLEATMVSSAQLATGKWRVEDYMDEIKILVNGSTEIKNLTGRALEAEQYFELGRGNMGWARDYATGTNRQQVGILLGREFYDHDYGLPLDRFDSVELHLKNDASSTYWSAFSAKVNAVYREENHRQAPTRGYVKTTKYREYTPSQNGHEYIDLPTENKILRVLMQADPAEGTASIPDDEFWDCLWNIKYSFKSGKMIMFDDRVFELMFLNALQCKSEYMWSGLKDTTADKGIRTGTGRHIGFAVSSVSEDGAVSASIPTVSDEQSYLKPEAREADSPWMYWTRGFAPERIVAFLHDRDPQMRDILDPSKNGDGIVKLDLHTRDAATADNGTNRVFLSEFIPA